MKKLLSAIALSVLSLNASAWVTDTAQVLPTTNARPNVPFYIWGQHYYAVGNDSGVDQNVAVCYTTRLCGNAAPQYRKTMQTCDKFTLHPGEAKNDTKNTKLDFNYPFTGYCDVYVETEIYGWQNKLAQAKGKLHVSP